MLKKIIYLTNIEKEIELIMDDLDVSILYFFPLNIF